MEDLKIDENKLNKAIENLPEVPRTLDGKIDLEAIAIGKNEKGDYIVPDEVFNAYYKELPVGTRNQNQSAWTTKNGGIFKMPTEDIRRKGADSLNARLAERKTNKEILEEIARKNTPLEELERLGLENSADNNMLVAANYAAVLKAIRGDIKALEYVRDTLGEKPADKLDASVTAITQEDREMLERMSKRLEINPEG